MDLCGKCKNVLEKNSINLNIQWGECLNTPEFHIMNFILWNFILWNTMKCSASLYEQNMVPIKEQALYHMETDVFTFLWYLFFRILCFLFFEFMLKRFWWSWIRHAYLLLFPSLSLFNIYLCIFGGSDLSCSMWDLSLWCAGSSLQR